MTNQSAHPDRGTSTETASCWPRVRRCFVIETLEHAQARGARIYGELAGAGITADAHDMVQPDPTGASQALAMTKALRESDLDAGDIKHVNAHATSTPREMSPRRAPFGSHWVNTPR